MTNGICRPVGPKEGVSAGATRPTQTPLPLGLSGRRRLSLREGWTALKGGNLGHPVHPARMKNDRVRQVSWLTGQGCSGRLLRTEMSQWRNGRSARRLQLQGQPEFRTPFPFDPLSRGTCRNCALIATGRVLQVRMLARIAALLYPQRRNGCPKGLNREVRGPSGQSRHCSRNCNRIAHRHDAIGNANSREGGEKARRSGSQETGPIPSFLRAGGMNRADEGQSRGERPLGGRHVFGPGQGSAANDTPFQC